LLETLNDKAPPGRFIDGSKLTVRRQEQILSISSWSSIREADLEMR